MFRMQHGAHSVLKVVDKVIPMFVTLVVLELYGCSSRSITASSTGTE